MKTTGMEGAGRGRHMDAFEMSLPRRRISTAVLVMALAALGSLGAGASTSNPGLNPELLTNQERLPANVSKAIGRLALTRHVYERLWERYRLKGKPPALNLKRRAALFAGIWKPNRCRWGYQGLSLVPKPATFQIAVEEKSEGCLAAETPQTMVISLRRSHVPAGELFAHFTDLDPFKVKRSR
jgi:hypothetical protein